MRAHHRAGLRRDCCKRRKVARAQRRFVTLQSRQRFVRIDRGRSVAGEVFVTRLHSAAFHPARKRARDGRNALRVGAVRTRSNNRVARIECKIQHRCEIERCAGTTQIERHLFAGTLREFEIVRSAQRHRGRHGRKPLTHTRDAATFLIDRNDRRQIARRRAQRVGKETHLRYRFAVTRKQQCAGKPFAIGLSGIAVDSGENDAARERFDRGHETALRPSDSNRQSHCSGRWSCTSSPARARCEARTRTLNDP